MYGKVRENSKSSIAIVTRIQVKDMEPSSTGYTAAKAKIKHAKIVVDANVGAYTSQYGERQCSVALFRGTSDSVSVTEGKTLMMQ